MSTPDLEALKAARDADRARLLEHIASARTLTSPAHLMARAKSDLEDKARSATMQAVKIANDNRGVVIATISALALWFLRRQAGQVVTQVGEEIAKGAPGWLGRIKRLPRGRAER